MKKLLIALSLVALSLGACTKMDPTEGTSLQATAGTADGHATPKHTVLLKGGFVTNATPVPVEGDAPGTLRVLVTGTGQVSHLGKATSEDHAVIFINLATGMGTGTGRITLTAANGDQIFSNTVVTFTPKGDGTSAVRVDFTITGGTGRFVGATGNIVGMDIANPQSPEGFLAITGQITY